MLCNRLTLIIFLLMISTTSWAETGIVSWVNWSTEPGIAQVVSGFAGVKAELSLASDGKTISTVDQLTAAGWSVENGCLITPQRSGGSKITLHVTGLPAGVQDVYVRHHGGARTPGNEWWFDTTFALTDGSAVGEMRLLSGLGGYDRSSMYETKQGSVGTADKAVSEITLTIERYIWTQFSKAGSIRIETTPSMTASYTSIKSPENDAVRAEFNKGAVKDASGKTAYCVRVVSGSLTVRPKSFDSLKGLTLNAPVDIDCAKGEYENKQVLLFSDTQDLKGVSLQASELKTSIGAVIPVESIMACPLGYVQYPLPYNLDLHGYWPDPILNFLKSFDVNRDDVQSVWYRVFVPRDAKPGAYSGKLTITPTNAPAFDVPVSVLVRNFEVPKMSHFRVVVGCNASDDFEMSYKINPTAIYGFTQDWIKEFPKWAALGVTALNLDYLGGSFMEDKANKMPSQAQLDKLCEGLYQKLKALEAVGLRDKAYLYVFDEADAQWYPAMRKICDVVKAKFPDLKIMTTAHDWTNTNPDGSAPETAKGRWTGAAGGLDKIDIWVPLLFHYNFEQAAQARKQGRQIWWYTCNSPQKPFPNFQIINSAMDNRVLMGFMAFAYGTDGYLYYATRGGSWEYNAPITTGPYTGWPVVDTGHDHLYQKGPDGKGLPSRRMEMLRDGLEDYDYLWIARDLSEKPKVKTSKDPAIIDGIKLIKQLSAPGNELVKSLTEYTQDTGKLESVRTSLAKFIEKAQGLVRK